MTSLADMPVGLRLLGSYAADKAAKITNAGIQDLLCPLQCSNAEERILKGGLWLNDRQKRNLVDDARARPPEANAILGSS